MAHLSVGNEAMKKKVPVTHYIHIYSYHDTWLHLRDSRVVFEVEANILQISESRHISRGFLHVLDVLME